MDDKKDLQWHVGRIKEHGAYEQRKRMYDIIDELIQKYKGLTICQECPKHQKLCIEKRIMPLEQLLEEEIKQRIKR